MELTQFKKNLDPLIIRFLDKKIDNLPKFENTSVDEYFVHLREFLKEGKRIRAYLAYLAYKAAGGKEDEKALEVLVFIELFHAFCLVHDDIMDRSDFRHNTQTIHKFITDSNSSNNYVDPVHFGNSQAILIGDFLFSWALEALLSNKTFDTKTINRVREIFFEMINEVILGQALDVETTKEEDVSNEAIYEKILLKTAGYSFIKPLLIGASFAGEVKNDKFFQQFGKALGIAFQVQDDLLDISDSTKTHKTSFTDIEAHQHTLLTNYVFKNGSKIQKETLKKLFGKNITKEEKLALEEIFEKAGAIKYSKEVINDNLNLARDILKQEKFNARYKIMFENLIEKIGERIN